MSEKCVSVFLVLASEFLSIFGSIFFRGAHLNSLANMGNSVEENVNDKLPLVTLPAIPQNNELFVDFPLYYMKLKKARLR